MNESEIESVVARAVGSAGDLATRYRVTFDDPRRHLVGIEMTIPGPEGPTMDLMMPIWTPGSYLVREYSRHVQRVEAHGDLAPVAVAKAAKNIWRVEVPEGTRALVVRYAVYAFEVTVRTSYVDADRAFLVPAGIFMWADGRAHLAHVVSISLPETWNHISSGLDPLPGSESGFLARDFDELVDSPLMLGNHEVLEFEVRGVPHRLAIGGAGNRPAAELIPDMERVVKTVLEMFGHVPYSHYTFLVQLTDRGFGGLEHHNSSALLFSRYGLRADGEDYPRWLSLVCHEFFHLFNVKRIRPFGFSNFDYTRETYTRLLWVAEGVTSYYDDYLVLRSGLLDARAYLDLLGKKISRLKNTPGRKFQNLLESSFDAWIKFYRPDEDSANSSVSYYLKGGLVTWIMDLEIRRLSGGKRSFADVMRRLYADQQDAGYDGLSPCELGSHVTDVAGTDLSPLLRAFVNGTDEIDFAAFIAPFGLRLEPGWKRGEEGELPSGGRLGLEADSVEGRLVVRLVWRDTAAASGGVYAGDEIVAIDGHRCTSADQLHRRLAEREVGQEVKVLLCREGLVEEVLVVLGAWPEDKFTIQLSTSPTEPEVELLRGWLGDLSSLEA